MDDGWSLLGLEGSWRRSEGKGTLTRVEKQVVGHYQKNPRKAAEIQKSTSNFKRSSFATCFLRLFLEIAELTANEPRPQ